MSDNSVSPQTARKINALVLLVILLIFSLIGLYAAPNFMDANQYKQYFIKEVSQITGKKVVVNGEASISINPFMNKVKLSLKKVTISDLQGEDIVDFVSASSVVLNLSLSDLITGKKNISSIELGTADIHLLTLKNGIRNWDFVYKVDYKNKLTSLSYLKFSDSILHCKNINSFSIYNQMNMLIDFQSKGAAKVDGTALNQDKLVKISAKLDSYNKQNSQDLTINFTKGANIIDIQGNVTSGEGKFNFVGTSKANLVEASIFTEELVTTLPFLQLMLKDKYNEPISATADIFSSNNSFDVKNIKIASVHTNGTGEFGISTNGKLDLYVDLSFENLDLTNFFDFSENSTKSLEGSNPSEDEVVGAMQQDGVAGNFIDFSLMDDVKLSLKLSAKEAIMKNISVQDIAFNFAAEEGVINKGEASFELKSSNYNTSVKLKNLSIGKVNDSNFILGDFIHQGNNINATLKLFDLQEYINILEDNLSYGIDSKILFSPKEISIFDINGQIGETGVFTGSIATKKEHLTDYNFDLKFNHLKLNNFDMPLFKERVAILLNKSNDDDYLSYFRWFRTLPATYSIRFEFTDTEFKNEKIDSLINVCRLEPGSMSTKGKIKSSFADGNYDVQLVAQAIKPKIKINMSGDNLDYNRLNSLMLGFLIEEGNVHVEEKQTNNGFWTDKKFNFFKIQKYIAQFDLYLKKLQFREQEIENFKFVGHTSNDVFYVDNLYLGIYGGQFQTRGNISFFDTMLYQFSFTTSGLESKDLLVNVMPKFDAITGPIAATGSIISQGNSPKDFVNALGASVNLASPKLNVKGIDSDVVVDIALKRKAIDQGEVLEQLNTSLNNGDTDITDINGSFKIENGIVKTSDTSFRTRFSNAAFVMSLNLNDMSMSSDTKFSFMPYNRKTSINYAVSQSGSLVQGLEKKIGEDELLHFVKQQYNLLPQIKKEVVKPQNPVDSNLDDKNYLYHQLEQNKGQ